jgi:hypothetical protein
MSRNYKNELEKVKSMNNRDNMQLMSKEAVLARENGISYGYFQAGLGPDFGATEYPVSTASYITRAEVKDRKKVMAFIK